jgi:hypothetical protein
MKRVMGAVSMALMSAVLLAVTAPGAASARPAGGLPPIGLPFAPPAPAGSTALGSLNPSRPVLSFHGTAGNPTPLPLLNSPLPVVCALGCSEFSFHADTSTPFLVSVRDAASSPDDGWDLYVWGPDGSLVGAGNGIGADGQAIEVAKPKVGTYTIAVTFTYEYDDPANYLGEVRLESGSTWQPPASTCGLTVGGVSGCFPLPMLQAVPASSLHVDGLPPAASTPLGFPLPASLPTPTSCYVDESVSLEHPSVAALQHPTTRCLRFTTDVQNVGAGPLEVGLPWLTSSGTSGFVPGGCQAEQLLTSTSGQTATRPAGACEFHLAHGHFHYEDLVSFALYQSTPSGPGARIGKALKESFCLGDDDYFGFGSLAHDGARNFVGQPGCNVPSSVSSSSVLVEEGISAGWGDVYTWDTPDQFVDITGLAPGTYDLVERTNPSNTLLVGGPTQTCALTHLRLTATAVATLSTNPSVPCPVS